MLTRIAHTTGAGRETVAPLVLAAAILAMPAAVLIKLLLRDAMVRYRMSAVYLGSAPGSE